MLIPSCISATRHASCALRSVGRDIESARELLDRRFVDTCLTQHFLGMLAQHGWRTPDVRRRFFEARRTSQNPDCPELRVRQLDDQGVVARKLYRDFQLRYVHIWEMHHLLGLCGYEVVDLFGDFERTPFDEDSSEMVWIVKPRE